jgi:DNA-binding NtrC family response regulator
VDDDTSICAATSLALELEGYAVRTAKNGLDALRHVAQRAPALVLLDLWMPVLDGWGFVANCQQLALRFPILIMSASLDGQRAATALGAEGFLLKPFGLVDLFTAVELALPRTNRSHGFS